MWGSTKERVDVYNSKVIYTLSAQKLFRRELLERLSLRFDENLKTEEDALFTMEAYLRGAGVSVISNYVCYYLVGRDDGKHVTKSGTYVWRFDSMRAMMALIHRIEPAGPKRDFLMVRPFTVGTLQQFGPVVLKDSEEVRRHKMELAAPLMETYWNDGVARLIKVPERLRLACVARGRMDLLIEMVRYVQAKTVPDVVKSRDGRKIYLAYPHFRDKSARLADSNYEVTVPDWHDGKRIEPPKAVAPRPSLSRRVVGRMRRDVRRWKKRLNAA